VQVTFVNDTHAPVTDLWFTYYGLDPVTGVPCHADATGKAVPNVPSAKPSTALAISIASGPSFGLPLLNAARLYVSVGAPLLFTVDPAGNPIPPQSANPSDPNYKTPWDFFEGTYIPLGGTDTLFNWNLSNVQSANLPLAFHVAGTEPSSKKPVDYTRGWLSGGYTKFLSAIHANPDFKNLELPDSQRVLAPGTAITAFEQHVTSEPLISEDYLKAYIAAVWKKFETVDLTFVGDPPEGSSKFVTWSGRVMDEVFIFTTDDLPELLPIVLDVPSTVALFENNFDFCVNGKGKPGSLQANYANQLFGTLCAAFNRSMMLTTTTLANSSTCAWCKDVAGFYQDPTTNHYSQAIHANTIEGLAYAFQSDDHCDVSSFVSVLNPTGLTITFGGL